MKSASLRALRTAAAKRRKKAEDSEAALLHIEYRLAEEGIGPGRACYVLADVEPVVNILEEDNQVAVVDHKHPRAAGFLVGDIELGGMVGHSPVVRGMEIDSEVDIDLRGVIGHSPVVGGIESDPALDIAPWDLPGTLAEESLHGSQHRYIQ